MANRYLHSSQKENTENNTSQFGKLVRCHFRNIKEQTQNIPEKPFKDYQESSIEYLIPKRDQRCYFKDSSIRVYSRGGSEFIIPMHFKVEEVYPIENGLLVKVHYDRDKLFFDPSHISKEIGGAFSNVTPKEWAYLTITEHPLNDIHPLAFQSTNPLVDFQNPNNTGYVSLLPTQLEILHVSYQIPLIVFYNPVQQLIVVGLIKKRDENIDGMLSINQQSDPLLEGEKYIRSLEPESRHPELFNIARDPKILIEEILTISSQYVPSKVFLSNSLTNSYELNLGLYFEKVRKYEVYQTDIRQMRTFKKVQDFSQIQDVVQLRFIAQSVDSVEIIDQSRAVSIQNQETRGNVSLDLKILKSRLGQFSKQTLILDQTGRHLSIYHGVTHLLNVDVFQLLDTYIPDKSIKAQRVEGITAYNKSNLALHMNGNITKLISLNLSLNDYMVKSVLKICRIVLPPKVFESLYQGFVDIIFKINIEEANIENSCSKPSGDLLFQDQLVKFTHMLLAILTGDHSAFHILLPKLASGSNTGSSGSQQQQLTPQSTSSKSSTTPTQTIQTKILRSSTTSFGAGDQSANNRRKTTTAAASGGQANQPVSSFGSQSALRPAILGRQASSGSNIIQPRKFIATASSSSGQLNEASPVNAPPEKLILSSNPFGDMLNSDFHKKMFGSQFKGLFPENLSLIAPVLHAPQPQQQQDLSVSPTKSTPSKLTSNLNPRSTQPKSASAYTAKQPHTPTSSHHTPSSPSPLTQQQSYPFKTQRQELLTHFNVLFQALHLLYEDIKLNKLVNGRESVRLARLLTKMALKVDHDRKAGYVLYYIKEHRGQFLEIEGEIKQQFKGNCVIKKGVDIEPVPNIVQWINDGLKGNIDTNVFSSPFPLMYENTRKVVRLYEILSGRKQFSYIHPILLQARQELQVNYQVLDGLIFEKKGLNTFDVIDFRDYLKQDKPGQTNLHPFEKILFALKEEGINLDELKSLPSIISLPFLEIIRYARLFQQEVQTVPQWPESIYRLIQREDIINNLRLIQKKHLGGGTGFVGMSETPFTQQNSKRFALNRGGTNVFQGTTFEEIQQETFRKEMETNIMKTAQDFINSQSGFKLGDSTNQDKSSKLMEFLKNRFSSDTRFKEVTNFLNSSNELIVKLEHIPNREALSEEQLTVERQKLLDKLFIRQIAKCIGRGALQFGTVQALPTETLKIPKINQTGFAPITETQMQVEFKDEQNKDLLQWPEFHNGVSATLKNALSFNKNRSPSDINQVQHTRNWIMYHKPAEPKFEHGGFCLALGLLGQFDTLQPTDIYQHLKSTHDATTIGILLGRAASKIGTMDDQDTRTLCIHIPYLLPPTLNLEVSLAVQSAAVIGSGLLYKGTSNRLMTEMLLAQIGRKPLSDKAIEREGYALASGIALGLVNLGFGNKMQGLIDLKLDERLIRYVEGGKTIDLPQSMLSQNFNHDNSKCSAIKEGDMVNVHITSQGALIALALIHLKSNNKAIYEALQMPETFFSLESVRPAFLLLKVLCKNLIMWDGIQCSHSWVESQIPPIIKDIFTNDITTVEAKYQQKLIEDGIDYSTVALCYVNIIAGAIFSIGFKFAGTGNKQAYNLVKEYCQFFKKLKIVQSNKDSIGMIFNNFNKNQIDKNTVETCLCVSAFAMSMIMAGTGDVDCFRTLRVLRKRLEHDMHYGYNMAIHMSLGFLFLGSGAFTFSRNDLAIASLLCSLYPVFPSAPNDNRYHLQALRHFYVLAIESRLLQARDIDTGEFLNLKMDVEVLTSEEPQSAEMMVDSNPSLVPKIDTFSITTPDIVQGKIIGIEVKNEQYHNVSIRFAENSEYQESSGIPGGRKQKIFEQLDFEKVLYVKKKNAQQTAQQENNQISIKDIEQGTQISETCEETQEINQRIAQVNDPSIQSFFNNFCGGLASTDQSLSWIEEMLIAQSKEMGNTQLSPAEFFKIQDLYDQIQEHFKQSYLKMSEDSKFRLLKSIHDLYKHDKLDLFNIMLDQYNDHQNQNELLLLKSYHAFKTASSIFKNLNQDHDLIARAQNYSQSTQKQTNYQLCQLLVKVLSQFHQVGQDSFNALNVFYLDLYDLQVAKLVVDQLMEQMRMKGPKEADILKKFKFSKINALKIEGDAAHEINEMLNSTILQIIGHKILGNANEIVSEVILPALIQIEL